MNFYKNKFNASSVFAQESRIAINKPNLLQKQISMKQQNLYFTNEIYPTEVELTTINNI